MMQMKEMRETCKLGITSIKQKIAELRNVHNWCEKKIIL